MILDSEGLHKETHVVQLRTIIDILNECQVYGCFKPMFDKVYDRIPKTSEKPLSRIAYPLLNGDGNLNGRLSISIYKETYICLHESAADLSILSDFEQFKENLDLIARSFVTLSRALRFE